MPIRRTRPAQFPAWRLATFLGGIVALFAAVASPLDTLSESLLFMHMAQLFVLMSIAPLLIVLGTPLFPCCAACPGGSFYRRRLHVGVRSDGILAACYRGDYAKSFLPINIEAPGSRNSSRFSNERTPSSLTLARKQCRKRHHHTVCQRRGKAMAL